MTVILTQVQVSDKKRNEFLKIMLEVKKEVEKEKGCKRFEIHQHVEDDFRFSHFSIWKTPKDLRNHLRSDEFSMMLVAFKLLRRNPEIWYFNRHIEIGLPGLLELKNSLENH